MVEVEKVERVQALRTRTFSWAWLLKACMTVAGVSLILVGVQHLRSSQLDRNTEGTVIGVERLPSDHWDDLNFLVGYQFMTDKHTGAAGTYLLENPPTLGDMPRLGSYLAISYSSVDPTINEPWDNQAFDMDELFLAEFRMVIGVVLLAGGLSLRR